jgi:hypothetical protein
LDNLPEERWRRQLREVSEKLMAERDQKRLEQEIEEDASDWQDTTED